MASSALMSRLPAPRPAFVASMVRVLAPPSLADIVRFVVSVLSRDIVPVSTLNAVRAVPPPNRTDPASTVKAPVVSVKAMSTPPAVTMVFPLS